VRVGEDTFGKRESEWRRRRTVNMADVLCMHTCCRTMKAFAIVLGGAGRGMREKGGEGNLTNVQCKDIRKCHNELPLYN
jgi:hypothetical protein